MTDKSLSEQVAALERAVRTARVEGAREGLMRFIQSCIRAGSDLPLHKSLAHETAWQLACDFRDREYPAPSAHAGELRWSCVACQRGGTGLSNCERMDCKATTCRPAPTPELEVLLTTTTHRTGIVAIVTPEDCRRIVALGSRPTQTAEG